MPKIRHHPIETFVERTAGMVPGRIEDRPSTYQIARLAVEKYDAMQQRSELLDFLVFLNNSGKRPAQVTEIGTAKGGNLYALSMIAKRNGQLISIDLPGGDGGGGYRLRDEYRIARRRMKGQQIHFIRGDSHDTGPEPTSTFSRLVECLTDEKGRRKIDLLYVDADHSYAGVKQDFETYSRLVRVGGMIALHDIVENPSNENIEVSTFWNEIKDAFKHREFIDKFRESGAARDAGGIGLITDWQPERYDALALSLQPSLSSHQS